MLLPGADVSMVRQVGSTQSAREEGTTMTNEPSRRKYERVVVTGSVRMMVDSSSGLHMAAGYLVDLCEGGCSVFLKSRVEPNVAARIQVEVGGMQMWLPVTTRWARCDTKGWTIGCSFDRPTPEKQRAIRALVWERRNLTKL